MSKGMVRTIASVCVVAILISIPLLVGGSSFAPAPTEVAVANGSLSNGATIPLPQYSDGSPAAQAECTWMVSLNTLNSAPESIADIHCSADANRVVTCTGIDRDGNSLAGEANYMIIAVRPLEGTAAQPSTWSAIKAQFKN